MTKDRKQKKKFGINITIYFTILISLVIILTIAAASAVAYVLNYFFNITLHISENGWVIMFSVILGVAVAIFVSKILLSPIKKLATAMKKVALRDFTVRLETRSSITEVRELYDNFNLMTSELGATEILQTDFVSNVSHEFKTPLAVIEGGCEKFAGRAASAPEEREEYGEILLAARRLRRLVKNLLDVSRLESGALKPKLDWCDLGDVIEGALAATREARRNHPVSVSLPPDYPLVKADFSLMEQVLVNLLLNACVHTPEGTSVTLQGGADPVRGQVWLDIHDMGPGIPPERAETIFERFRTTRPGGLGLGLPIVRGFMEAQRGAVSLVPVSAGTCFRLVLPLVEHDSVPEE